MTHRIWNSIKGLSVVCAASLGYQAHAQAQDAPAAPESGRALEEVVVTAQRRAEAVNDIGISIQAIDSSKLDQLAVANVQDLSAVVPSFNVAPAFTGVPTYTLRGVGFNTINISATSTVGTYIDEAAYAYPIMNTGPLFDLDRVEVLKGPQGTLYGRNSTAGLINFISAKPTKDFQAEASADVGNFETLNAGGFVSGPLFGDVVQGRLAFRVENSGEGWQESVSTGEEQGEIEKYGVRGSLALQPFDSTKLDLSVNWFKNRSGTLVGQAVAFTPATDPALPVVSLNTASRALNVPGIQGFVNNNFPDEAEDADFVSRDRRSATIGLASGLDGPLREGTEFTGFKLRLDQDLTDNIRLVSLTNYNRLERDTLSDFGGVPNLGAPVAPAALTGLGADIPIGLSDELLVQNTIGNIDSFAEDLHLEGKFGEVNYLVGGYYANDRILDSNLTLLGGNANTSLVRLATLQLLGNPIANDQGFTVNDVLAAFRLFADFGEIKTESMSVFANADAPLTDQLKLSGGVRYTEEEQEYKGCSLDVGGNLLPTVNTFNRFMFVNTPDPSLPFGAPMPAPVQPGGCVTYNPTTNSFGLVRSKLDQNNVAGRLALDYKPTDGVLLYASASQGSKAGTTPVNAANISTQNAPVGQERLRAYELGTKATLFGRSVQANVSGFYYDYKDKQLNTFFADPIFTALARLDNIPESHVYGVETDVTWRVTDGLTLNATFLGLETEIDQYIGTNSAGVTGIDFSGSEFNFSPKFQGSLSAFYTMPLGSQYLLSAALNGRAQSSSRAIIGEADQMAYNIPGYAVVNGSVGFGTEDGKWNVSLFGRNLLDKYFFNSVVNSANTIVRFANPPRQFGATLTYKFN